jgi:ketosteroid isomerase-like protein
MKKSISVSLVVLMMSLCTGSTIFAQNQDSYVYKPQSQELYNAIVQMDSVYFSAYNACDMDKQAAIYADSIEFYHDGSGLETSKKDLLAAIKQNICGKVTRVLVKGSIEVYQIPNFGAVEIGLHRFINHAENNNVSRPDKFIVIWRHQNDQWHITRVISLHTGNK